MPQLVACHGCGQHFMAADHILGTVVACPNCGSPLAIPAPQPLTAQPAASPAPVRTLPPANFRQAPAPDQNKWNIAGVVAAVCLLWLLTAAPSLLLWAAGRPAASMGQVGAGAVIFWIGILAACGGLFEWSFFMNSNKMQVTRQWFGDQGAKWFYTAIGGVVALMGLGVTISATAYSLFATSVNTQERPDFAAKQEKQELVQPLAGPQVSSPPPQQPAPNAPAATPQTPPAPDASPVPADKVAGNAQQPSRSDFSKLPGQWRYLEGGYCIKVPATVVLDRDSMFKDEQQTRQDFGGSTKVAQPDGVNFAVHVAIHSRNQKLDTKVLYGLKQRQPQPHESGIELILVNGLPVVKSNTKTTQPGPLNRKVYTHHGTTYQFAEKHCTVTLSVYSQLPLDHPDQQAVRAYLNTFQRLPETEAAAAVAAGNLRGDGWRLLEGGFRIPSEPVMEIRKVEIWRRGPNHDELSHLLQGQTADGVEFQIDVLTMPKWNKPNEARATAAARSQRPRPDYRHEAVDINGLVMERITTLPRGGGGRTHVEYKYLEGQHQIVMSATSMLPLEHPSFQAVIKCLESIERMPAP